MKMKIGMIMLFLVWASAAPAQRAAGADQTPAPDAEPQRAESPLTAFDAKLGLGYRDMLQTGGLRAGEYEYLKSSGVGDLDLEWDPLPHRFVLESYYLNQKDYFAEADYAYRDVVLFNMYTRGIYHNLNHYSFGPDDPTTLSPSSEDRDPGDLYAVENQLRRAFIRFKVPDFPFHLYAEAKTIERDGTIQQRFLRGFTGTLDRVSQSRTIDWNTQEIRVGANSHLGYLEADYSHTEKQFKALADKVLYDSYTAPDMTIAHNLVPNLVSSSDTVKVHTTYSGKFVAAATYTGGDKRNRDSDAKATYQNLAGDVTLMPYTSLAMFFKYRHYDLELENPPTVAFQTIGSPSIYSVRNSISLTRDVVNGIVRFKPMDRLTLKGEYAWESTIRGVWPGLDVLSPLQIAPVAAGTGPASWDVARRTTKGTAKVGAAYRLMNRLTLRADYSHVEIANPAYDSDPDKSDAAHASLVWTPTRWLNTLVSYGSERAKRDNLAAPLAGGSRDSTRNQALGSVTLAAGRYTSITAGYAFYQNKVNDTITYRDLTDNLVLEPNVPYADTADVASLSVGQALAEGVQLTADASQSYSRGHFKNSGTVAGTTGLAQLSDLKVVETIYAAGLAAQVTKTVGAELRYSFRDYEDKLDATQDGKVQIIMATLSMKW